MTKEELKINMCKFIDQNDVDDLLMFVPMKLSEDGMEIKNYLIDSMGRKWDAVLKDENFLKNMFTD